MFFLPGLIWFHYEYTIDTKPCNSPLDNDLSLITILYFVYSIMILINSINTCKHFYKNVNRIIQIIFYLAKFGIFITMIVFIQRDYNGDWDNWDNNNCPSLKSLTLFWLIWNYIFNSINFIFGIIYFNLTKCY